MPASAERMTLINAWWHEAHADGEPRTRHAFVACDRCLPSILDLGTAAGLQDAGWQFEELEGDAHYCPWCKRGGPRDRPRRWWPAEEQPALPNLIVIGSARCGTSSLHRYLSLHPDVHMSRSKELNFFADPTCLAKLDTYATFFDRAAPVRGESSPRYTCYPLAPGVPDRIRAAVPETKLIYLVRDPIERTISHYVRRSSVSRPEPFERALADVEDPYNMYVAPSKYATQLEQYMRLFPDNQLLVIDQADFAARRSDTLRRVFRFLGVSGEFWSPEFEVRINTRETTTRKGGIYTSLSRGRMAMALRRRISPGDRATLFGPVKRLASSRIEPPALGPELRARLQETLRGEVERLREMTGQEFASWQI